jgi:hypothetical protein
LRSGWHHQRRRWLSGGGIGVYGWDNRTSKLIAPDRTDSVRVAGSAPLAFAR